MMKRFFPILLLLPLAAQGNCEKLWDVAELAKIRAEQVTLKSGGQDGVKIPTRWFQGLNIIRQKIDAQSGISTTAYLCDAREPNAFAWREGGQNFVALTVGMYDLIGDDWHAYAALVGHENTHLVKNHGRKRQKREIALTLGQMALGSILARNEITDQLTSLAASAFGASYSRDEEREADQYGMIYAHCAGFSPQGAIRLHKKLDSSSNFLSSHPSSKSRISALQSAIAEQTRAPKCRD